MNNYFPALKFGMLKKYVSTLDNEKN
jgi:hypothetical protein